MRETTRAISGCIVIGEDSSAGSVRGKWLMLFAALGCAAWALWLSWPYLEYGERSFLRIHDCGDSNLSMAIASELEPEGCVVGKRNATQLCGFDHRATWGSILQDHLFAFVPAWLGYGINTWMQRFIAGLGILLLAKWQLRLRWLPSISATMSYSLFSQFFINASWGGFTYYDSLVLPGFPWVLLVIEKCLEIRAKKPFLAYFCAALVGALCGLTGSYLLMVFPMVICGVWPLLLFRPNGASWLDVIGVVGIMGLFWAICCWPFVQAALRIAPASHRADLLSDQTAMEGLRSVLPYLRGAIVENWPFVVASIVGLSFKPSQVLLRLICLLLALIAIVLLAKPIAILGGNLLGPLQGFQWQRFYLLLPFAIILAGSAGLSSLWDRGIAKAGTGAVTVGIIGVAGSVGTVIWTVNNALAVEQLLAKMTMEGWSSVVFEDPALKQLAQIRSQEPPFRTVVVAKPNVGQLHPGILGSYGLECADGYVPLYSDRYHSFWQAMISARLKSDPALSRQFNQWGNRAYLFPPKDSGEKEVPLDEVASIDLLRIANVRFIVSELPLKDPGLRLVRHDPPHLPPKHRLNLSDRSRVLAGGFAPLTERLLYELIKPQPRFYLAESVHLESSEAEVLESLSSEKFGLRPAVFVEKESPKNLPFPHPQGMGKVEIITISADHIVLDVKAESPSILVVVNTFDPIWTARVDGRPSPIFRVNHVFQGICVPEGSATIELTYGVEKEGIAEVQ